jgi:hypothetical protein
MNFYDPHTQRALFSAYVWRHINTCYKKLKFVALDIENIILSSPVHFLFVLKRVARLQVRKDRLNNGMNELMVITKKHLGESEKTRAVYKCW